MSDKFDANKLGPSKPDEGEENIPDDKVQAVERSAAVMEASLPHLDARERYDIREERKRRTPSRAKRPPKLSLFPKRSFKRYFRSESATTEPGEVTDSSVVDSEDPYICNECLSRS